MDGRVEYLKHLYLAYFSRPKDLRTPYREIRRRQAVRLVEIGIVSLRHTVRMIKVAGRVKGPRSVEYTALDLFDARPGGLARLPLKQVHRRLRATGAQVRLVPGDPLTSLGRVANMLPATDLVTISAIRDADALRSAWFYIPRMLHPGSLVLRQEASAGGPSPFLALSLDEVQRLAGSSIRRRAA